MMQTIQTQADTQILMCHLDADDDMPLSRALACLSKSEKDRMQRFVFPHDQLRFARGRAFLRHSLSQRLDLPPSAIAICQGPNGKPFVRNTDIVFNLSHSQSIAVLAVADTGSIGIDIELSDRKLGSDSDLINLGRRCFTASEMDVLQASAPNIRHDMFLRFWTAKEARMKLWGEGMAIDPRLIELRLNNGLPVGFHRENDIHLQFVQPNNQSIICCYARSHLRDNFQNC